LAPEKTGVSSLFPGRLNFATTTAAARRNSVPQEPISELFLSDANALASWGYAMFLDDEIAATRARRRQRWGFYLALAALAACIVMVLGLTADATAQAAENKPQPMAAYASELDSPQPVAQADRQILIGLTLIATALPAGTAFALWRSRIALPIRAEARRHVR
jgi:hypothetical protein